MVRDAVSGNERSWRLNALWVALLTVALAVSGCSSKTPTVTDASSGLGSRFDATTGAIDGIVVNANLTPIEGAQVALESDMTHPVLTDSLGVYAFSHLAPGQYALQATRIGFMTTRFTVDVVAGAATSVPPVQLIEKLIEKPHNVTLPTLPGRFFCGAYVAGTASPCKPIQYGPNHPVEQAWSTVAGFEKNIFYLPNVIKANKTLPTDRLSTLIVEITWQSSGSASDYLWAQIEEPVEARTGLDEDIYASNVSRTGLRIEIAPGKAAPGAINNAVLPVNATGFTVGVFPAADPNGVDVAGIPLGPALFLQQSFEVHVSFFYNGAAPAGYSALAAT